MYRFAHPLIVSPTHSLARLATTEHPLLDTGETGEENEVLALLEPASFIWILQVSLLP